MNSRERKRNKLALFGGTFDPVHNGHLALALAAYRQLEADEILFMPTKLRYYKTTKITTSAYDRYAMLTLATQPYDFMRVSDLELCSDPEENYTVNTLRRLKEEMPDTELYFLIGGDSLEHLGTWRDPEGLFSLATFAAAIREDVDRTKAEELIRNYQSEYPGASLKLLSMEAMDVSSTVIRERAAKGDSLDGLVPENVEAYIRKQHLYQNA